MIAKVRRQSPWILSLMTLFGAMFTTVINIIDENKILNQIRNRDFNTANNFLPETCHKHVVEEFPTLTSLLEQGKDSSTGEDGGHWSACTHIKIYGMNFAAFFARHLAYGLKPKSVLEFGCGLGTTSDFLARFVPGGSKVVCVEPEAMIGEVFGQGSAQSFPHRPVQLSMLSFAPEAKTCSDALYHPKMGFELVLSLEVAEHVPPEYTGELVQRLAMATSKYLVFSAGRPGQEGHGHIDESMHERQWWIEQFTNATRGPGQPKLVLLPQLSRAMRHITGWSERAYDLGTNLVVFGVPGVGYDIEEIPQIAHDCKYMPVGVGGSNTIYGDEADRMYAKQHQLPEFLKLDRPCEEPLSEDDVAKRQHWLEGQEQALWPELDLLIRRVRSGELEC